MTRGWLRTGLLKWLGTWLGLAGALLALAGCWGGSTPQVGAGLQEAPAPRQEAALSVPQIRELEARIAASDAELVYVSDYTSFVGRDERGFVAFALDNNRGRSTDGHQAEHFALLHDERDGFAELPGTGKYPNPERELIGIPDSASFEFEGTPDSGLRIRSKALPLELTVEPIALELVRAAPQQRGVFAMGAAAATLRWGERVIPGRVIHEYLLAQGWNRLAGLDLSRILNKVRFQGLYLRAEDGSDLYLHETNGGLIDSGSGLERIGFQVRGGEFAEARGIDFAVQRTSQGLGLFRWPAAWRAGWQSAGLGEGRLELEVVDFKRVGSLLLGGFGMGIARGTLEQDGRRIPVYGWAELIQWR